MGQLRVLEELAATPVRLKLGSYGTKQVLEIANSPRSIPEFVKSYTRRRLRVGAQHHKKIWSGYIWQKNNDHQGPHTICQLYASGLAMFWGTVLRLPDLSPFLSLILSLCLADGTSSCIASTPLSQLVTSLLTGHLNFHEASRCLLKSWVTRTSRA